MVMAEVMAGVEAVNEAAARMEAAQEAAATMEAAAVAAVMAVRRCTCRRP